MEKSPYIEGYMSKRAVRSFLENYNAIRQGDFRWKEPTNSKTKSYDGITGGQLNKIMIDEAIKKLPKMERNCVICRWIRDYAVKYTCNILGIDEKDYYRYCSNAVKLIYKEINRDIRTENDAVLELMSTIFDK